VPLGSASVAQVHRAVLTKKYGHREVAVKVQRPSIEEKLMGDVANLKQLAKLFRSADLPIDYYTVFSELEEQLKDEFDFEAEAASMERMHNILTTGENGLHRESPIVTPRSIPALVSKRVLVMDYLKGVPLSRVSGEMQRKGIAADGVEAKLFARKLLKSLTTAFGWSILESGFFHAGKYHNHDRFVFVCLVIKY
jgi:aarF domain-containing kinase